MRRVKKQTNSRSVKLRPEKFVKVGRGIMVLTIIVSSLVVVTNAVAAMVYKPGDATKAHFEEMARDYYENYFWAQADDKSVMADYSKGMYVTLGTLLVYDGAKNAEYWGYFNKYGCDSKETYAAITPTEPYGQQDYDLQLEYSCNF